MCRLDFKKNKNSQKDVRKLKHKLKYPFSHAKIYCTSSEITLMCVYERVGALGSQGSDNVAWEAHPPMRFIYFICKCGLMRVKSFSGSARSRDKPDVI
jgi:hypothetical protein